MDAARFDRLTQRLAQRQFTRQHAATAPGMLGTTPTRRTLLRGLLGGSLGALLLGSHRLPVAAQSTTAGIAEAINAYRQEQGLAPIPVSDELTRVAQAHVADIVAHHPEDACNGNLPSWSDNGNWTGGCYDPNDETTWPVMWNKPNEIAGYPGKGYEILTWGIPAITADEALSRWQGSAPHNDVMLNGGIWVDYPWGAIGGWVADGYACAWFGEKPGTPSGNTPVPAPPAGGGSSCPWGPNQCLPGYVWRVSTPDDLVCVTPEMRDQVAEDNALAEERKDPACADPAAACGGNLANLCQGPNGTFCIDRLNDPDHCGDCTTVCENDEPACINGVCSEPTCLAQMDVCGAPNTACCVSSETGSAMCSTEANSSVAGEARCCVTEESYCRDRADCCDDNDCIDPGSGTVCAGGTDYCGWCCRQLGRSCTYDMDCCYGLRCSDDQVCVPDI